MKPTKVKKKRYQFSCEIDLALFKELNRLRIDLCRTWPEMMESILGACAIDLIMQNKDYKKCLEKK